MANSDENCKKLKKSAGNNKIIEYKKRHQYTQKDFSPNRAHFTSRGSEQHENKNYQR